MNKLKHVSVSQYKTYTDCPRKWYIEKVVGIRSPGTQATKFGSEFHEFLENYVGTAPRMDLVLVPKNMERFMDASPEFFDWLARLENPKVEEEINYILPVSKVPFIGFVDLQSSPQRVEDYKTVGDWKWALDKDGLREDIQMNMYAHLLGEDKKILTHYQFNKKTYRMKIIEVPYTPRRGKEVHDLIDEAAIKMKEDALIEDVEDTIKNTNSCGNYGGCPFRDFCTKKCNIEELKVKVEGGGKKDEEMNYGERLKELASEMDNTRKKNVIKGRIKMGVLDKLKKAKEKNNEKLSNNEPTSNSGNDSGTDDSPKPVKKTRRSSKSNATEPKTSQGRDKKRQSIVLVDCNIVGIPTQTASELCMDRISAVVKNHKASCLSAIPYNAGIQDLAAYSETILDELVSIGDFRLDTRLPFDAAVYSWIFQLGRSNEFMVVK